MPYEGINAISTAVTALFTGISAAGVLIAVRQLTWQRREWRAEHERARREKAIELLHQFIAADNEQWAAATKLIERLDKDCLNNLEAGEPFQLKIELKEILFAAISSTLTEQEKQEAKFPLTLTKRQVFALRWHAYCFLNGAEIVLQAWYADVADRGIIAREMAPLYSPREGRTFMQEFRNAADGEHSWPAIHEFLKTIAPPKPAPTVAEVSV